MADLNAELDTLRAELDDPEARTRIEALVYRARDEVLGSFVGAFTSDAYRPFFLDRALTPQEQYRLLMTVRNDRVFEQIRQRLGFQQATLSPRPGLADELTDALVREQGNDYERALVRLVEIYDGATEAGVQFTVAVTDDERAEFALIQLNGRLPIEHVGRLLDGALWGVETDIRAAFERQPGFAAAIAEMRSRIEPRFTTVRDAALALMTNLTTLAANRAQREVTEAIVLAAEGA